LFVNDLVHDSSGAAALNLPQNFLRWCFRIQDRLYPQGEVMYESRKSIFGGVS
jgi:hypothetical protein